MADRAEWGEVFPPGWCLQANGGQGGIGCANPEPPIHPDNEEAIRLLNRSRTQMIPGGLGPPIGFAYDGVARVARVYGIDFDDPDTFERFQVLEDEYLTVIAENLEREKPHGRSGENSPH